MSNFACEHCGTVISDSETGYVTGCEHYLIEGSLRRDAISEEAHMIELIAKHTTPAAMWLLPEKMRRNDRLSYAPSFIWRIK